MSQDLQEPRKGTQVVHVRENSGNELDALFSVVAMNPQQSGTGGQVPLRMRNLPASFWKPPEPNRHVKQGSNDSTGYPGNLQPGTNLPIHMRTQSSPATLGTGLSAAPPPQAQHTRQHSCDALLDSEPPLPPGWEMAKTQDGQRYYLNHDLQVTTWQDPRKTVSNNALNTAHRTPPNSQSPNVSMQNLGPLPPGWEQACTPEGDVYYINHMERTTSWYDPRIPERMQQLRINTNQLPGGPPGGPGGPVPRQMAAQMGQMPNRGQSIPVSNTSPVSIQYSKLQIEKELLRKRQEDLQRQEMMLRAQMQQNHPAGQGEKTELTTVTDPFLGQSPNTNHIKQESGDSGVGGMGSGGSYTLSRTPEDFLSNVSEMEQDPAHRQGEFNNMDIGNIGGNEESSNMDSEDLVPSLQEDISSELLNDMENVLNTNKLDNMLNENLLTWL